MVSENTNKESLENNLKLFDGDDEVFKNVLKNAKTYFEFGAGESTQWVLNNTNALITCVDSNQEWLNTIPNNQRIKKLYIDIGPVKKWGYPIDNSMKHNWMNYYNAYDGKSDVVLIDGRFRVACFLSVLKKASKGTVIIFDDYLNGTDETSLERPHYHVVENVIKINKTCGRQAVFIKNEEVVSDELMSKYVEDTR